MKNNKNILLKAIFIINGLLLMGMGVFIIINANENIFLVIFGIVPVLIGMILISYSFLILSQANKTNLRTCASGTVFKISCPFLFKYRGLVINNKINYYIDNNLKQTVYIDLNSRRLAIGIKSKHYLIIEFSDINNVSLETESESGFCEKIKISLTGLHLKEMSLNLINKPIKLNSRGYHQKIAEAELIKQILYDGSSSAEDVLD